MKLIAVLFVDFYVMSRNVEKSVATYWRDTFKRSIRVINKTVRHR